jgi:hypothetical protein
MELTLETIAEHFPEQVGAASSTFMACVKDVGEEMKIPGWKKMYTNTTPDEFFRHMAGELLSIHLNRPTANKSILTALVKIEKCWINRYLNYPHGLALGYTDSLVLRKHLRADVARFSERFAKRYAPKPPVPLLPLPAAAAVAIAPVPAMADAKSQYPSFTATMSVFGRQVIPIGFTSATTKNKTGGAEPRHYCNIRHPLSFRLPPFRRHFK